MRCVGVCRRCKLWFVLQLGELSMCHLFFNWSNNFWTNLLPRAFLVAPVGSSKYQGCVSISLSLMEQLYAYHLGQENIHGSFMLVCL